MNPVIPQRGQQPWDSVRMKICQRQKELQSPEQQWLKIICIMLHQNISNICANRWLLDKILSNSQIWREISNKKLNYHLFCFSFGLTRFLCRENVVMLFQKWLNITGMPWATLLTTRTPRIPWDWRQERARNLANRSVVAHSDGSNMFASYTAKSQRVTQTRNNNNVGNLSACVCLIRH